MSSLSPQDLISVDTAPAKERLEDSCVHPLEEAMLGCDMDGEDLWPFLLPTRARADLGCLSATPSPLGGLWSPLTGPSLVCLLSLGPCRSSLAAAGGFSDPWW